MDKQTTGNRSLKKEFWESKIKPKQVLPKGSATMRMKESKYLSKIMAKGEPSEKWWQVRYIFHPEAGERVVWDLLILVFIIHQALTIPYFICFNDSPSEATNNFEFMMNICFMIDILVSFNTGFYVKGELILNRTAIVKDYLKFWFWVDIIASLPYSWFVGTGFYGSETSTTDQAAMKAPKVLRIIRIFRFLKILRLLRLAKLKKILMKIEDYIASNTLANIFVFAKLISSILFIAHWTACIWFYIGDQGSDVHPVTWITAINMQDKGFTEKYITSLYWALTTMSTVGYGDITPYTMVERIYAMLTMIMASGVFAFTIGSIGTLVSKANAVENEYREQVVAVNRYMRRKGLPRSLQFRVRRYLDYLWEIKKKNKMDEKSILVLLSEPLRDEIYSHIHGVVIKACKIFDTFEPNFISQLARTLINETFAPGDTIVEEGEMTSKMYFILNGKVIIYHSFTKSLIRELGEKEHFGEISFFTENSRCASVKCVDFLDVLSLTRINFNSLIEKFPESNELSKVLIANCLKGDYSSLLIRCYICDDLGHYATKCSNLLINLDQQGTRNKWLQKRHLQESRCISLSENINPNFRRKERVNKIKNYSGRNVVGIPRNTLKLFSAHSAMLEEPVKIESSTGDSVDSIKIRPAYTQLYLDSESDIHDDDSQKFEKQDRNKSFKLSLVSRNSTSHDTPWKSTIKNAFMNK